MEIRFIAHNTQEYQQMVDLRDRILRQPLGLRFDEEELEKENQDLLIAALGGNVVCGCCILSPEGARTLRLRQMAVAETERGTGLGRRLLGFAEQAAKERGFEKLVMHARESAAGFYEKSGYKICGDIFLEVTIPHFLMEKELT